jgi:hypothetical protein
MESRDQEALEDPTQLPSSPVQSADRPKHAAPYAYQPLKHKDSIRLLEFAASYSTSTSLACSIIHARSETDSYEALSYVWGPPVFSEWLHEKDSDTHILITQNLHDALYRLSCRYQGRSWRVWVDAVCIDQSNLRERNHQVKSMASIFSKATKVLVWLGSEECGSAFSTLNKLVSCCVAVDQASPSMIGHEVVELVNATRSLKDTLHTCDVVDLGRFFDSAWFTRVWILQEFLLAKNIDILMGGSSILYENFESALLGLKKYQACLPRNRHIADFDFERDYFYKFKTVCDMFHARHLLGCTKRIGDSELQPALSLYQWCRMLEDRRCIDERDRVYAALGLATKDLGISPDYRLSFADICLDLAKKSLLAGDFSVLYDASTPMDNARKASVPSFIPSLRASARKDRPSPIGGYVSMRYSAGLAWPPMIRSFAPASITIGGVGVGEVIYMDNFADALIDLTTGMGKPFKPQLLTACNRIASLYAFCSIKSPSSSVSFQLSLWRTINLGFVPEREDLPYYEKGFDFQCLDLPYRQNITRCFRNRVFFITSAGSFGMGPAWLQEGDRVVIFDGAETPFILRQANDETKRKAWRLIGDCYLEGWMFSSNAAYKFGPIPNPIDVAEKKNGTAGEGAPQKGLTLYPELFTLY